jgi:hypothetical protein
VTDEETKALLIVELRLHGLHPDWIRWAMSEQLRRTRMPQFMLDTLEGRSKLAASLIQKWKEPMTGEDHTE